MADFVNDALNGMAKTGAPRQPMRDGANSFTSPSACSSCGMPVAKGHSKGGAIGGEGTATHKSGMISQVTSRGIKMKRPAQLPEAAHTQANGRIIPSSHSGGKNFWSQA